jgi:polysaccharide deacetylase 2 family uncharacterized protein YibQ
MPIRLAACLVALLCLKPAQAYDYERDFDATDDSTWPVIALIIDDMGDSAEAGWRVLNLPGPVACSILPRTPFAHEFAVAAYALGKEVLLHQPLEATANNSLLGPGAIMRDQSREQLRTTLQANLDSLKYVSGINNHMGSLLTQHVEPMSWMMAEIRDTRGPWGQVFFVDSVTTPNTRAQDRATAARIPNARRDVFLDHVQEVEHVAVQFEALKKSARQQGYALGIGHPYEVTLAMLDHALPRLAASGYRLVSVRELIEIRDARGGRMPSVVAGAPGTGIATFEQE